MTADAALVTGSTGHSVGIRGAGSATFEPIINDWIEHWGPGGRKPAYEVSAAVESVQRVLSGKADFAAIDSPLAESDLQRGGLTQFPVLGSQIAIVENINIPVRGGLRLNADVLAGIFTGKISRWDDPDLARLNPGCPLPAQRIVVVRPASESGATHAMLAFLDKSGSQWVERMRDAEAMPWAAGVELSNSKQVAEMVVNTPNSIGYLDYSYALSLEMHVATLIGESGQALRPSLSNIDLDEITLSPRGAKYAKREEEGGFAGRWPIRETMWIVLQAKSKGATKAFVHWAINQGSQIASARGYTPLSVRLAQNIDALWGVPGSHLSHVIPND